MIYWKPVLFLPASGAGPGLADLASPGCRSGITRPIAISATTNDTIRGIIAGIRTKVILPHKQPPYPDVDVMQVGACICKISMPDILTPFIFDLIEEIQFLL